MLQGQILVTNGDFATDTNWTKGTGVTIASGVGYMDKQQLTTLGLTQSVTLQVTLIIDVMLLCQIIQADLLDLDTLDI